MILRIEDILEPCSIILSAVDANDLSQLTKTVELKVEDSVLYMAVTNREYVAEIKIQLDENVNFHATVDAETFLRLISSMTCDTVEFTVADNALVIKGNGVYKLPLIFNDDKLLELPRIVLNGCDAKFEVEGNTLVSLLTYNSKQFSNKTQLAPVQRFYYVDEEGAITFTFGACVNKFKLDVPVKMMINQRLARLFKLFKGKTVQVTTSNEPIDDDIVQSKARFQADNINISAILTSDKNYVNEVPVTAIRGMADEISPYSVSIDATDMLNAVTRLQLFAGKNMLCYIDFECNTQRMKLSYNSNVEELYYHNADTGIDANTSYSFIIDANEIKNILDSTVEQFVNVKFGNDKSVVLVRKNIYDVIPEIRDV